LYKNEQWRVIFMMLLVRGKWVMLGGVSAFLVTLMFGLMLSAAFTSQVSAQSLYKWIDENGNVTYQDSPPPADVNYEEQVYIDPDAPPVKEEDEDDVPDIDDIAEANPVSFYSVPDCDACDLTRLLLDNNLIPYAEKDIQNNISMQQELQQRSGKLQAPTVIIGDKVIDGYSKSALTDALLDKGYPLAENSNAADSGDAAVGEGELTDSQLEGLTNVFDEAANQLDEAESESPFDEESVVEIQAE
jgi:glutaredoxin